jgi:hypothetical protein
LFTTKHFSASEFIVDPKQFDSIESSQQQERKLKCLKKRSSILNYQANDEFGVFCPKPECALFFKTNILACALHYKYAHTRNHDVEIYSIAKLERTQQMEIEKKHNCPQCKHYHSKLVSLCEHLKREKHFPCPKPNEINVFVCPFESCFFKAGTFFSFKNHLLSHKDFVSSKNSEEIKVKCTVNIYTVPKCYYHVTKLGSDHNELERECEKDAIVELLDAHKNQGFSDVNALLKTRKEQLHQYHDKDRNFH